MLEAEGTLTLMGILRGGGIDCSRLDDKNYVANDTGHWMRVSSFTTWIEDRILNETRVGREMCWEIFSNVKYFSGRSVGAVGAVGQMFQTVWRISDQGQAL